MVLAAVSGATRRRPRRRAVACLGLPRPRRPAGLGALGRLALGAEPLGLGGEAGPALSRRCVEPGRLAAQLAGRPARHAAADRAQLAAHLGRRAGGGSLVEPAGSLEPARSRSECLERTPALLLGGERLGLGGDGRSPAAVHRRSSSSRRRAASASRLATTPASISCPRSRSMRPAPLGEHGGQAARALAQLLDPHQLESPRSVSPARRQLRPRRPAPRCRAGRASRAARPARPAGRPRGLLAVASVCIQAARNAGDLAAGEEDAQRT